MLLSRKSLWLVLVLQASCGNGSSRDDLTDVGNLFASKCDGALCHTRFVGDPAEGLDLSPDALCSSLVGVPSAQQPGQVRLSPGSPQSSYLLCKLEETCPERLEGSDRMPLAAEPLLPDEMDILRAWISDGAPGCPAADESAPSFDGATNAVGLNSAIRVEWSAASDEGTPASALIYHIYAAESSGGQDFSQPTATTLPGATAFTDGPLPISTDRFYVVRAQDPVGNIDGNTNEVSATTLETPDATPPTFAGITGASPAGSTAFVLSWSPATDDVTPPEGMRYRAYAATAAGAQDFGSADAESAFGASEIPVSGLLAETDYFFVVRAVDAVGNEDSNTVEISGTTGNAIRFSTQVQPIFTDSCATAGCHQSKPGPMGQAAADLDLRSGMSLAQLVNVPESQCNGDGIRVVPGDSDASVLADRILGRNLCAGSTKMPKVGTLTGDQIQTIVDWIDQGALDN